MDMRNNCGDKYKVLVVDDSQLGIDLIFELSEDSGYEIHSAVNARMALDRLKNERFDLVLLDVMMPVMNGYEVCREIKNTPGISDIPVIFITAKNDFESVARGFEAGAVDYVTKPFNARELVMRVKTHLDLIRSKQELEIAKELAEESSRAKGQFLANMSHEIRTPLYGVTGMIDLLRSTGLSSLQSEYLELMQSSANTLLTLINDILDFSRIEAGEPNLQHDLFDLRENVYNTVSLLKLRAGEKRLHLEFDIDEKIPPELIGDPVRINQVISNLTSNAIKFTNRGKITVNVTLQENSTESVLARFEISDTGIGISDEDMGKLFRDFSQVDGSTTREHGGAGLGLVISKKLVELMGGKIGVTSNPGKGSVFWFTCRLNKTLSEMAANRDADALHRRESNGELKVLLVEDSPVNAKVARIFLQRMGHEVDMAENGIVAVDKFFRNIYDLILMDINMPEMDGYEATRIIRQMERENGGNGIKIVAMTANAMAGDREKCLKCGMDDYISKPFKPADLEKVIAKSFKTKTCDYEQAKR